MFRIWIINIFQSYDRKMIWFVKSRRWNSIYKNASSNKVSKVGEEIRKRLLRDGVSRQGGGRRTAGSASNASVWGSRVISLPARPLPSVKRFAEAKGTFRLLRLLFPSSYHPLATCSCSTYRSSERKSYLFYWIILLFTLLHIPINENRNDNDIFHWLSTI